MFSPHPFPPPASPPFPATAAEACKREIADKLRAEVIKGGRDTTALRAALGASTRARSVATRELASLRLHIQRFSADMEEERASWEADRGHLKAAAAAAHVGAAATQESLDAARDHIGVLENALTVEERNCVHLRLTVASLEGQHSLAVRLACRFLAIN